MMSLTSSTRWSYGVRIVVGEDISISFAVEHVRSLTELPDIYNGTPFPITGVDYGLVSPSPPKALSRSTPAGRWRPGKGAVDVRRHHQLVQRDSTVVVVQERDVVSIASGGDAHHGLPRGRRGDRRGAVAGGRRHTRGAAPGASTETTRAGTFTARNSATTWCAKSRHTPAPASKVSIAPSIGSLEPRT